MDRLATSNEKSLLKRLRDYINKAELTPNHAWTCLSQPEKNKKFGKKNPVEITFSDNDLIHLKSLKGKLIRKLEERSRRCCSYCKRPVGKHGYGWHVEHVFCKSKHQARTFDLDNLVLACIDCNMIKNQNVDRKSTAYDIINPSEKNFDYSKHLNFALLSTEDLCILTYATISEEGKSTYKKLKFDTLERMELINSMLPAAGNRIRDLDDAASQLAATSPGHPLGAFLAELKHKICSK